MKRLSPDDPRLTAPDFPHGEYRGWRRGCSCVPCRTANAAAVRARRTGKPTGPTLGARVPPTPECRQHLVRLLTFGTVGEVSRATGLHPKVIRKLRDDPTCTVTQTTINAVLAVDMRAVRRNRILVPANRVRRHVQTLLEPAGVTTGTVAAASGLSLNLILDLVNGRRHRVLSTTAITLLAVQPSDLRPRTVPPRLAIQRIKSLQANGHMVASLARELGGVSLSFLHQPRVTILASTDAAIADLYHRLGDTPGPSAFTAGRAGEQGWLPPIFYDDDGNLIAEAVRRADSTEAWHEQAARRDRDRLRLLGLSLRGVPSCDIADQLGVSTKQIQRVREIVGLHVTYDQFDRAVTVLPGQDELVARVRVAVDGIDLTYPTECCDTPGIDYRARFDAITGVPATQTETAA
jgi:hypothetical protein